MCLWIFLKPNVDMCNVCFLPMYGHRALSHRISMMRFPKKRATAYKVMSTSRICLFLVSSSWAQCVYCRLKYCCSLQIFFFCVCTPTPTQPEQHSAHTNWWTDKAVLSVCIMCSAHYSIHVRFTALRHNFDKKATCWKAAMKQQKKWCSFLYSLCMCGFAGVLYCLHSPGHCRKKGRNGSSQCR